MENKDIVVELNKLLPKLEVFEESVDMGLATLEFRYIKVCGIEITVNNRNKGCEWNRAKDEVHFISFRKPTREKIKNYLEGMI